MKFISIKDLSDPRIAPYRSLKGRELERNGIFIAEGEKVVKCMLESGYPVLSALASVEAIDRCGDLLNAIVKRGGRAYIAPNGLVGDIIGFRFHKGIMASGRCPKRAAISGPLKAFKRPLFLVALDSVNDPQNVGLIARNAAAFGAQSLLVNDATYDPYYRKSVRVSMGAIFRLKVFYEPDLGASLIGLKKRHGLRIIAATPGGRAGDIADADLSGDICIVFGNEDKGVSRGILRIADSRVRIPISDKIDSLNVASASAIFLHQASRCRSRDKGSHDIY